MKTTSVGVPVVSAGERRDPVPSWKVANSVSCLMKPISMKGASGVQEATSEAITSRSLRSWRS